MSNQKGFTLTEILVYTTLIGIVGSLFGGILITVTKIQQQQGSVGEVNQQLQFVMSAMQRLISSASVIDAEAGTPVSTLTLRMQDPAKDPTVITVTDQTITLREGTNEPVPLTTESVLVEKLFFTRLSSYPGHDSVQIDLAISANTQNPSEQLTKSLSSAVARVSAATFDADLIPGADGQFDVGLPSNRWQNLYLLGNVGIGTNNPQARLEISGTGQINGLKITRTDGLNPGSLSITHGGGPDGNDTNIDNTANGPIIFQDSVTLSNPASKFTASAGYWDPDEFVVTSTDVFFSNPSVKLGVGTTNLTSKLTANGIIESTSGGFKFPDGTTQATAATGGGGGDGFWVASDSNPNNILNNNSGSVGVGTTLVTTEGPWAQTGSSFALPGIGGWPAVTALNGTDIAFIDHGDNELRTYRWNGSSWSQLGNSLNISAARLQAIAALNSTDVAFIDTDNDQLRTYRWDGSSWTQIGIGLAVSNSRPAVTALNSTDIAFIDEENDQLRTYRWNGSSWTQIGSGLAVSNVNEKSSLTTLNSTDVAFINMWTGELRTYRWNGSSWTQIGSGLSVPFGRSDLAALNNTDVAIVGESNSNTNLRMYRWNGSSWAHIGSGLTISGIIAPALTGLNGTDVAFTDGRFSHELRTYRWAITTESIPFVTVENEKVGIGRTASANALEVEGNASKSVAGSWLANSDQYIKTDIRETGGLSLINQLHPITFRYTPEYLSAHPGIEDKPYYNFIAQEFQKVFPDAVKGSGEYLKLDTGERHEILQVDTHNAFIASIKAIQELDKKMESIFSGIKNFIAETVKTKIIEAEKLCLKKGDGSSVCLTGDELQAILDSK